MVNFNEMGGVIIKTPQESTEDEIAILEGRKMPTTELELQMHLAEDLFERDHFGKHLNSSNVKNRNAMLEYWIESKYSSKFRKLVDEYKKTGRDIFSITLMDVASSLE